MMKPNVIAAINVSLWIGGWAFPISNTAIIIRKETGASVVSRNNQYARPRHTLLQVSMMSSDVDSDVDDDDGDVYDDDDNTSDRIIYPPRKPMQSDNFLSEFDETIDWEPLDIDEMDDFFNAIDYPGDDYVDIEDGDEDFLEEFDKETLLEILGLEDDGRTITISNEDDDDMLSESELFSDWNRLVSDQQTKSKEVPMKRGSGINKGIASLERALLGGVVPVEAGVGSGVLPGDQGFDPLDLSTKDYFKQIQNFILKLVPARKSVVADENQMQEPEAGAAMPTVGFVGDDDDRPPALILRDYREAEIRHGRLAMLAAIIWPLQEILDRIFIPDSFGSTTVIYGGPTLPFMPLLMTFFLLNLGYLDIYSR